MNIINYKSVHPFFKLNGIHLNEQDLCVVAYNFIKEGDEFEKNIGDFLLDWFDGNSFIELFTSGTTGSPKSIKIKKQFMVNSAIATGVFFELNHGDKVLHCLPVKYIAGKMMLIRSFILGLDIDIVAPSSKPLLHNTTKYDFVAMVPLQAQNSSHALRNVKKLIVGGAKISKSLEKKLTSLKTVIYETYGMTETITHIAAKKCNEIAFTVLPNVFISQDERNCLVINAPDITDDIVVTNDLVELLNDKQFVFLGRIDNIINSGGVKLIPEQIEEKLSNHIHTRFFVTGMADAILGQKLVLIVEGEKQVFDKKVFDSLDKYEIPKEIFFISKFIETQNGKIKRKENLRSI